MDKVSNISLPAGLSLNSAVSIIPTSPHKVSNNVPNKVSSSVSSKVNYIIIIINFYYTCYLKIISLLIGPNNVHNGDKVIHS